MKFISYDLGTGGVKASLYDESLTPLAKSFIEYPTFYPASYMHEQRPADWWNGVIESTKSLLSHTHTGSEEITAVALSGQSLVSIPIDAEKKALLEQVPIWSDTRAGKEADEFFKKIDNKTWYLTTGNGFPAPCYSLFKLMWYKKNEQELFGRTVKVLGSKDYINFMLTGKIFTDFSYASGSGAYDLLNHRMRTDFLEAAQIPESIFPEIVPSHHMIGTLTEEAARQTGLSTHTQVACGGVDNACMALGAIGTKQGKIYTALGSSSWVPVNSSKPVLDYNKKPYVFAHIDENMYTSAFSIFAGGSSFRWVRDTICTDLDENAYDIMAQLAATISPGSNGLIFNPSLAGGTSQDKSIHIRGAYVGLNLGHTRAHLIRAAMEGIALNLKLSVDSLKEHTDISDEILFCGGGSKSDIWMQIFADIFNMKIIKTNIDQDAASLGAAAICARSCGLWKDYDGISKQHHIIKEFLPNKQNVQFYAHLLSVFKHVSDVIAALGEYMREK